MVCILCYPSGNKAEETDEHLLCRKSAEATRKSCLVTEERKRQEKKHVELCKEHPTLVGLTENTLRPIVQEKDPEIKELVIEQIADKLKNDKSKITQKEVVDLVENTRASRAPLERQLQVERHDPNTIAIK